MSGFVVADVVEDYFTICKRGTKGTYQHCGEQQLQRYPSGTISGAGMARPAIPNVPKKPYAGPKASA